MAKGSVRKKGKKWYYRFYVEDESGRPVQKEFAGTESKSETEALLRKAMEDYESKKFVARSENITLGALLDMWLEEEVKPGSYSNGTVMAYQMVVKRIKNHPIAERRLKTVTPEHLQSYIDLLSYGDDDNRAMSGGYIYLFSAILRSAFRFAVFPKKLITFNPMQYVVIRNKKEEYEMFSDEIHCDKNEIITHDQFIAITQYLADKNSPALLPIQIAYYTGLRIGEVCSLTWQDINFDEQYITVRHSIRYNTVRHKTIIGTTKRNKIRTVDFCDTLAKILRKAKTEQAANRLRYGELYRLNYCKAVTEKNRTYYEVYTFPLTERQIDEYKELDFVCTRNDGSFVSHQSVGKVCRVLNDRIDGLVGFHFHMLRHTFTSNLLSAGASPKDVQELLGHSDVSTTMNVYAHATREAKRTSARLLDKVVGDG